MEDTLYSTVTVLLEDFLWNVRWWKRVVHPARVCVVLKADAYGHGLRHLAPVAVAGGADYIGICSNGDARDIRRLGIQTPLLRLRPFLPEELSSGEDLCVEEEVGTLECARLLLQAGHRRGVQPRVHIVLDCGMGRTGFYWPEDAEVVRHVVGMEGLNVVGIMTHFPKADSTDVEVTTSALDCFESALQGLGDILPQDVIVHAANSALAVRWGKRGYFDMVRLGAACLGNRTSSCFLNPQDLRPVMRWTTRIARIRTIPPGKTIGYGSLYTTPSDRRIATLPLGFGEGYPRALANKGVVLVRGSRCAIVGRISLNVITVDVSDVVDAAPGDEVVLLGRQGGQIITAEELADLFGSVHTEIQIGAGGHNTVKPLCT